MVDVVALLGLANGVTNDDDGPANFSSNEYTEIESYDSCSIRRFGRMLLAFVVGRFASAPLFSLGTGDVFGVGWIICMPG